MQPNHLQSFLTELNLAIPDDDPILTQQSIPITQVSSSSQTPESQDAAPPAAKRARLTPPADESLMTGAIDFSNLFDFDDSEQPPPPYPVLATATYTPTAGAISAPAFFAPHIPALPQEQPPALLPIQPQTQPTLPPSSSGITPDAIEGIKDEFIAWLEEQVLLETQSALATGGSRATSAMRSQPSTSFAPAVIAPHLPALPQVQLPTSQAQPSQIQPRVPPASGGEYEINELDEDDMIWLKQQVFLQVQQSALATSADSSQPSTSFAPATGAIPAPSYIAPQMPTLPQVMTPAPLPQPSATFTPMAAYTPIAAQSSLRAFVATPSQLMNLPTIAEPAFLATGSVNLASLHLTLNKKMRFDPRQTFHGRKVLDLSFYAEANRPLTHAQVAANAALNPEARMNLIIYSCLCGEQDQIKIKTITLQLQRLFRISQARVLETLQIAQLIMGKKADKSAAEIFSASADKQFILTKAQGRKLAEYLTRQPRMTIMEMISEFYCDTGILITTALLSSLLTTHSIRTYRNHWKIKQTQATAGIENTVNIDIPLTVFDAYCMETSSQSSGAASVLNNNTLLLAENLAKIGLRKIDPDFTVAENTHITVNDMHHFICTENNSEIQKAANNETQGEIKRKLFILNALDRCGDDRLQSKAAVLFISKLFGSTPNECNQLHSMYRQAYTLELTSLRQSASNLSDDEKITQAKQKAISLLVKDRSLLKIASDTFRRLLENINQSHDATSDDLNVVIFQQENRLLQARNVTRLLNLKGIFKKANCWQYFAGVTSVAQTYRMQGEYPLPVEAIMQRYIPAANEQPEDTDEQQADDEPQAVDEHEDLQEAESASSSSSSPINFG